MTVNLKLLESVVKPYWWDPVSQWKFKNKCSGWSSSSCPLFTVPNLLTYLTEHLNIVKHLPYARHLEKYHKDYKAMDTAEAIHHNFVLCSWFCLLCAQSN